MVDVLVLESDVDSLDSWGYLLQSFDIPQENCHFPFAPDTFKWQARHTNIPQDRHVYVFMPDIGVYIQGNVSLASGLRLLDNSVLVFGGDHSHLRPETVSQFLPGWEDRCDKVYIPQCHDTAMHGANAGAIALWEWRRNNGWHGN